MKHFWENDVKYWYIFHLEDSKIVHYEVDSWKNSNQDIKDDHNKVKAIRV